MTPYEDSAAHLIDELRRLDLLLRLHVAETRAGAVGENRGGGLYVSDEEVDRLLHPNAGAGTVVGADTGADTGDGAVSGAGTDIGAGADTGPGAHADAGIPAGATDTDLHRRLEAVTEEVRERRRETHEAGTPLRLVELAERFDLDDRAVDALLLSLAPEFDRKYERVYAYLQDDITQTRPSVGLVLDALADGERDRLGARDLFAQASPLVADRLVRLSAPDDDAPLLAHRVTADQRVVGYLLGRDDVDPALSAAAEAVEPATDVSELPVDDATRDAVARLAPSSPAGPADSPDASPADSTADPPAMRYVHGPYGSGANAAVEAMCREAGESVVVRADVGDLLDVGVTDPVDRLVREAALRDGAVHVASVHELRGEGGSAGDGREPGAGGHGPTVEGLARRLDRFDGHVFLTGEDELPRRPTVERHEFATVHLPRPGYDRRKELWDRRADALPDDVDTADLAATFRLTRGQMDDAISTARALENGEGVTSDAVYRGCRVQSRETLGALARKAETTYAWDDIVLPADEKAQLREVAAHVKHRGTVYADWGFGARFSLGTGMNVLFSGPSGTGKTMAAEIIAGDAGLDMFKVDLATVVSKYIGETEENLKKIFDEAEHTDAVLFFDEADALFGERSEVSDSHDRYANVEVSYLLQRMEEHDGAVILASNFKENIDDAFLRRINANVEFPRPDRESRVRIWQSIFPEEAPVGDLDWAFLSRFEITGGNIKNVALTAAFLAADDGSAANERATGDGGTDDADTADDEGTGDHGMDREGTKTVEMEHVVRALRRELQKTGRLVNPEEFGEYREYVR